MKKTLHMAVNRINDLVCAKGILRFSFLFFLLAMVFLNPDFAFSKADPKPLRFADNIPPVITCPADITANSDTVSCGAVVNFSATATDDSSTVTISYSQNPGTLFPIGSTTVIATATDYWGNSSSCSIHITVSDNQSPVIACGSNIFVTHDAGVCGAVVNYSMPAVSDNCGTPVLTLVQGYSSGSVFPLGTTTVTYTATDTWGNSTSCSFNVSVSANFDPENFAVNGNAITLGQGCYQLTPANNFKNGSIWYQNRLTLNYDFDLSFNSYFGVKDANGADGMAFVLQSQSINAGSDGGGLGYAGISPSIAVEFDSYRNLTYGDPQGDHISIHPNGNINESSAMLPSLFLSNIENGQFHATRITWNAALHTMKVYFDGVLKVTLNQNILNTIFNGNPYVYWGWTGSTGSDNNLQKVCVQAVSFVEELAIAESVSEVNCIGTTDGAIDLSITGGIAPYMYSWSNGSSNEDLSELEAGTYLVTVTDKCMNVTIKSITVETAEDIINPVINTAPDIILPADPGSCFASSVILGAATASDNCGIMSISNNAPSQYPLGETMVIWTIADLSGNISTANQRVTVFDDQHPSITAPSNITVNADIDECSATILIPGTPLIYDNCGIDTVTNNAPGFFLIGNTTVTWTVVDVNELISTSDQIITVIDNQPPVINCQENLIVSADMGLCSASNIILSEPTATDNCGIAAITNDYSSTDFPIGITTITWTVTDVNGNTSTCSQDVWVTDDWAPSIDCPADITTYTDSGLCSSSSVSLVPPTYSDNCGILGVENDAPSVFPTGSTSVTWIITDIHDNSSTCTQTITVTDSVAPAIVCENDTVILDSNGEAVITANDVIVSCSENCAMSSTSLSKSLFTVADVGNNPITVTATDIHGNISIENTNVYVIQAAPIALCQNIAAELDASGSVTITGDMIDNGSYSSIGSVSLSVNPNLFTCANIGANTVTLTVTDNNGSTATCSATVTVNDVTPPTAVCQNVTVNLNSSGTATITAAQINNGSADACGIATMSISKSTFTCAELGDHAVTLTVTDNHGNSSSSVSTVTVTGTVPVCTITAIPSNNTFTGGVPTTIYIGYGPQSVTLSASASGGTTFSYSWSGNGSLSCINCAAPIFTALTEGNYSFTVITTNENGCSSSATISLCVFDIRVPNKPGKVYLCHKDNANPVTKVVSASAVPSHLNNHAGDHLGTCTQVCGSQRLGDEGEEKHNHEQEVKDVDVQIYPNPVSCNADQPLTVEYNAASDQSTVCRVLDMEGRVMFEKNIDAKTGTNSFQVETKTFSPGIYFIQLIGDPSIHQDSQWTEKFIVQ